jgi:hypothetical protein
MSATPLDGMQFLLCRDRDVLRTRTTEGPCCRNLAYYRNGKLWCQDCKRSRGLPPEVIAALLAAIGAIPGIKDEVHILQDRFELPGEVEAMTYDTESTADPVEGDT